MFNKLRTKEDDIRVGFFFLLDAYNTPVTHRMPGSKRKIFSFLFRESSRLIFSRFNIPAITRQLAILWEASCKSFFSRLPSSWERSEDRYSFISWSGSHREFICSRRIEEGKWRQGNCTLSKNTFLTILVKLITFFFEIFSSTRFR